MKIAKRVLFKLPRFVVPESVKKPLIYSFVIFLVTTVAATAYFIAAQPEVPIFYSLAQPNQQLAAKSWLFLFPGIALIINLLHLLLLSAMKEYEAILLKLFGFSTVAIQFLLLLALLRIIYITW